MVYNIAQCENIPEEKIPALTMSSSSPVLASRRIIKSMPQKPEVKHEQEQTYYHPLADFVNIPALKDFPDGESYFSALIRQLVHSTGHVSRLNRKELMEMKQVDALQPFSLEELVGDIASSFLNSYVGIKEPEGDQAKDIEGWLTKLKEDRRFIVFASTQAQKAVDFILNTKYTEKEETAPEEKATV